MGLVAFCAASQVIRAVPRYPIFFALFCYSFVPPTLGTSTCNVHHLAFGSAPPALTKPRGDPVSGTGAAIVARLCRLKRNCAYRVRCYIVGESIVPIPVRLMAKLVDISTLFSRTCQKIFVPTVSTGFLRRAPPNFCDEWR